MVIAFPKKHKLFFTLYFCTIAILLLSEVDTFPLGETLRKIKYVYLLVMFVLLIREGVVTKKQLIAILPLLPLVLHALLFGFVFTNPAVLYYTEWHVRECLFFYLFVFLTFYYVSIHKCFLAFVELSYFALVLQLGFAALTHLGDFVNPIYYVLVFNASSRIRGDFGYTQFGYTGNYVFCAIALSLILLHLLKKEKWSQPLRAAIVICDIPILCMAFSAGSRSSIVSMAMMVFFYAYFEFFKRKRRFSRRVIQPLLFLVIAAGIVLYCMTDTTRELNIEGNKDAFQLLGNFWTGMGYVDNHSFQENAGVFRARTTSLDISYVYYYFSTGFIGCLLIGAAVLLLLFLLLRCKDNPNKRAALAIFFAMLFYAYCQVNLLTYTFYSNYILLTIYLAVIAQTNGLPENESKIRVLI